MKHTYRFGLIACIICLVSFSCSTPKDVIMIDENTEEPTTNNLTQIITTPVVTKNFVKKNGVVTDIVEYYIRQSIQDYFIKFCESSVSSAELEAYLKEIDGEIKTVTFEVEIRDGNWDICDENLDQQSRVGEYMIIHRIIEG